ncbi:GrpE-domain-containing protein [Lanmaoa asiatica]|nr:GrpE-domain-containing protein [Lanmaoa asiatica]
MNGTIVRRVFSASTAAFSSTRRLAHPSRPLPFPFRPYSDQKSEPEDTAEPAPEPESTEVSVESQVLENLKKKEAEVQDLTGRLRYLQADFLNLQRNAAREKEQQRDFAITRFAGDLLETVDVLALALKSVPPSALHPESSPSDTSSSPDATSTPPPKSPHTYLTELHQGVEMTHRLLLSTLFKYHVKSFDPTGEKFDPNRHEALYQAPIPGKEPGTVLECQKTGYMIKDRLLRAAQVGVVQDAS